MTPDQKRIQNLEITVKQLLEWIGEENDGQCGCHLLAPEEGPCVICDAENELGLLPRSADLN